MDKNSLALDSLPVDNFSIGMLSRSQGADHSARDASFHQAFERAAVGIFQTTPDGRFLEANPTLAHLLGYASSKALTDAISDIACELYVDPNRRDEFARMIEANGAVMNFESQVYRHGGEVIWISENVWLVRDAAGAIAHYEGFVEDISQQKRAEATKRQSEAAEVARRVQSQFMANISHEIRTPLNGVIGMLELMAGTELTPQQKRYAKIARVSADSLLSLISDVLDFAEIEKGTLEFQHAQFNLQQLLEEVIDTFIQRIEAKGLELALHVHPAVPHVVCGDAARLRQILVNLVSNAIKFTERGEVIIRVSVAEETTSHAVVRFAISDTGIGIPRDRMDCLFKSFSQVDGSATRKYGGMGLGLAVSKHLVDQFGGSLGVESEVAKGSTFHFTFKLEKRSHVEERRKPPADLANLRILGVDDNATNLEILQAHLTAWKYTFALADSGPRALELLEQAAAAGRPFEVAILDMQMPDMDGLELAAEIRRRPTIKDTVLVMLTSTGESMSRERMISNGLAGYLSKPVHQSRLFDTIVSAVANSSYVADGKPLLDVLTGNAAGAKFPDARILLAEDNEINQMVASEILFKAGYRCDIVATGLAALEAILDSPYDLVLMDCQMPDLDGFEATRAIREHERDEATAGDLKRIPIVALTANAAKGDRAICLSAGMDAYVTKPIDPSQLIGTIDNLLATAKGMAQAEPEAAAEESATEFLPASASPFHLESLLHRCLGDASFCATVLRKFADRSAGQMDAISQSIDSGNATDLILHAHTLKGVAANLSADELRASCAELERKARTEGLSDARDQYRQIEAEMNRCLEELPIVLAQLAEMK